MKNETARQKLKAALIVNDQGMWAYDTVLACTDLALFGFNDVEKLFPGDINPYGLPVSDDFEVIYVASHSWRRMITSFADEKRIADKLRKHCQKLVIIDGWDSFDISITPATIDLFDSVLKVNGVYKDKDLYNWQVGCDYPGVNWDQKTKQKTLTYANEQLDKIHVSIPCISGVVPAVKRRVRNYNRNLSKSQVMVRNLADRCFEWFPLYYQYFSRKPEGVTHFLGDLAHVQRLELIKLLKSNHITGSYAVFRVLDQICGRPDWRNKLVTADEKKEIESELEGLGLIQPKKNRLSYLLSFFKYQTIISPVGFGEMCFRHLEIMQMGKCGILQDLGHVDHLGPFEKDVNVLFCKPDFSDLITILREVETKNIDVEKIGKQAYKDAIQWNRNLDQVLHQSLIVPLYL